MKQHPTPSFTFDADRYEGTAITANCVPHKKLLVIGDAPTKAQQFSHYLRRYGCAADSVMSINRGVWGLSVEADYLATMHCDSGILSTLIDIKKFTGNPTVIGYRCNGDQHKRVTHIVDGSHMHGTSSLLGVLAGLVMGYGSIDLVAVDMLPETGYGSPNKLEAWEVWAPYFEGRVKSFQGSLVDMLKPREVS